SMSFRSFTLAIGCLSLSQLSAAVALTALATTVVSRSASAADDDEGKGKGKGKDKDKDKGKDEKGKSGGGGMDSGDPVDTEKSDDGPFKPHGKTGVVEEKHEEKVEIEEVVKANPRPKLVLFAEGLIGFGKGPPPPGAGKENGTGSGTAITLQAGGRY